MYEINYALLLIIPETKEPEKAEADDDQSDEGEQVLFGKAGD